MPLKEYSKKRSFDKTPEPAGKVVKGKGALRFVVQKHDASQLHYDFRLEMDGVLKSWAVPKGPSLVSHLKHLAMMVEDHPYEYRNFEGVIPEGEYGAGSVIIWDEGTYHSENAIDRAGSEKELAEGLKAGHLVFVLEGKKIKGLFALVRFKTAGEHAWLLFKKDDRYTSTADITKKDRSVRSNLKVEEVAEQASGQIDTPKSKLPHNVKPMLCTLVEDAFDDPDWIFEIKWDGYRTIAEINKGKVDLYSRNLQPFNAKFPPVVKALEKVMHAAVLDGEVVALDESGRASFGLLQDYAKTPSGSLVYYVFDILHLDGHDLTGLPLLKRKEILKNMLPKSPHIKLSEHIEKDGKAFFEAANGQSLEGVVAKRKSSTYQFGKRGADWLKIKTHLSQEAVIAGFTEPKGARELFGALILGVYEKEELIYIGHTGGGFDGTSLKAVYAKLEPLVTDSSPFKAPVKTNAKATWVKPKLVCEVKFQEWTSEGQMRQPIFLGMRPDKKPEQVKRELPK